MKKFTLDTLNKTAEKYRDMQSQSPSDRKNMRNKRERSESL